MARKKRILFVDDEPRVLDGLRRMLHPMRRESDMVFVSSGQEAMDVMGQAPCDVIVTDMCMPGMDGGQLLSEVGKQHPQAARIVLSGQAEREAVLQAIDHIHQYLCKPCDAQTLRSALTRACALQDLLIDGELKRVISRITSLPAQPSLYRRLMAELQSPEPSPEAAGRIVAQDVGMAAKVLQLVNSSFFGPAQDVSSPTQAVRLLGLDTIVTMASALFSPLDRAEAAWLPLDALWDHSRAVGVLARRIATAESAARTFTEQAAVTGLLHDAGKLALAVNLPKEYAAAQALASSAGIGLAEAERETLGATHAEVGAYLLGLWGLPEPIVTAIAFHHHPARSPARQFSPLTTVHVANVLDHEARPGNGTDAASRLDATYLTELNLAQRLPVWRSIFQEPILEENNQ
jgi:HD-like signal output (HDOD) protein/CheY-like chemotaxis protein